MSYSHKAPILFRDSRNPRPLQLPSAGSCKGPFETDIADYPESVTSFYILDYFLSLISVFVFSPSQNVPSGIRVRQDVSLIDTPLPKYSVHRSVLTDEFRISLRPVQIAHKILDQLLLRIESLRPKVLESPQLAI